MTDIVEDSPKYPKAFFTKRHDMWPEEFSSEEEFDNYNKWKWWITSEELSRSRREIFVEVWKNGLSQEQLNNMLSQEISIYYLPVEEENNQAGPATIMDLFCLCHSRGVYPPPWLMNDLYQKFAKYMTEKLNGSDILLDEVFAGKSKSLSKPAFKQIAIYPAWETAISDIHLFRIWFGLSIKDATAIVIQYPKLGLKKDNGFATAEKKYKKYCKISPIDRHEAWFREYPPRRDFKLRLVKRYPKEAFLPHWPIFQEYCED